MNIFDQFDKDFDSKALCEEVKEVEETSTAYEKVPVGEYPGYITSMGIKATKNTDEPMVVIQYKITDGQYKNRVLYINFVITKKYPIHKCNLFLRSLGSDVEVDFKTYGEYNTMICNVFDAIDEGQFEYDLKYTLQDDKWDAYEIVNVYKD